VERLEIRGGPGGFVTATGQYLAAARVLRPFVTASPWAIVVREGRPETLTLYRHGRPVFTTLVNTGVAGAATPVGQFYVRAKFPWVTMRGRNPDGQPYLDPHVPWVMSIDGNIALHGFVRRAYGFPQSAGCVELPVPAARKLYAMVPLGTPVRIEA